MSWQETASIKDKREKENNPRCILKDQVHEVFISVAMKMCLNLCAGSKRNPVCMSVKIMKFRGTVLTSVSRKEEMTFTLRSTHLHLSSYTTHLSVCPLVMYTSSSWPFTQRIRQAWSAEGWWVKGWSVGKDDLHCYSAVQHFVQLKHKQEIYKRTLSGCLPWHRPLP